MTTPDNVFKVDPSVVFQLGEALISDVVQALLELVKNSYDADASYASVAIDTHAPSIPGHGSGIIVVRDDGVGMTLEQIRSGWLTISASAKRGMKSEGVTTRKGRTPLGDKGLGRLGLQRLGNCIEIDTKIEGGTSHRVSFEWSDFRGAPTLENVPVRIEEHSNDKGSGTTITITELTDVEEWRSSSKIERLQDELSRLISPYSAINDFNVYLRLDGAVLDLGEIGPELRRLASATYQFVFDGERLTIHGKLRIAFFRPPAGKKRQEYLKLTEDEGYRLAEFLTSLDDGVQYQLERTAEEGFYLATCFDRSLVDILGDAAAARDNPGPFTGEIDIFDLGATAKEQKLYPDAAAYRDHIKRFAGIRVYRDGFGIRVGNDWLDLAEEKTSGASYYSIRPKNTLGYVALTAAHNKDLVEKTDREGFQYNSTYVAFESLMREVVLFINGSHEMLRRGYNKYAKAHHEDLAEIVGTVAETLQERLRLANGAAPRAESLRRASANVRAAVASGKTALARENATSASISDIILHLENALVVFSTELERSQDLLRALVTIAPLADLVLAEIEDLNANIEDMYELVATGITVEAFAHEITNVIGRLSGHIVRINTKIKRSAASPADIGAFVEVVRDSINALRKQLAHIDPTLRYARDKRDDVSIARILKELFNYHQERVPEIAFEVVALNDFSVEMNVGRFSQVIDNLILNSEYWLELRPPKDGARITALVDQHTVLFHDNGPGVLPELEAVLFDPFRSGKPRGQGRGLGLFVAKQLLAADRAEIELLPERNASGRRFVFALMFGANRHE